MVNSAGGAHSMKEVIRKQKEMESGLGTSHDTAHLVKGHKEKDEKESNEEAAKRRQEEENERIKAQISARAMEQQLELERIKAEKEEKKKAAEAKSVDLSDVWSADEQSALESALKAVGKDDAERWEKIAAIVKTKNKKQCVARVKHIKDEIMKKKGGK